MFLVMYYNRSNPLRQDARVVWATKGLEAHTGRLLQDVAREVLGNEIPLAVLSGPTFAKELAAVCPLRFLWHQRIIRSLKSFNSFSIVAKVSVYKNPDFIGVQWVAR